MSALQYRQYIYITLLCITFVVCILNRKILDKGDKVFPYLFGMTLLQEVVAYICYRLYHNNMITYHIYSPIELFLLCVYFSKTTKTFRDNNLGIWIGVFGLLAGICNSLFVQHILTFNSYYLLFEGTTIIIISLVSLCEILLDEEKNFKRRSSFWITLALMLYWSITYTGWGLFNLIEDKSSKLLTAMILVLYVANLLFYTSLSLVFINYKKLFSCAKQ